MTKEEALDLALEALESCTPEDTSTGHVVWPSYDEQAVEQAITAVKQARSAPVQSCYCPNCEAMGKELAALKAQLAPVQEPVAWRWVPSKVWQDYVLSDDPQKAALAQEHGIEVEALCKCATSPAAQRQWVGLTPREIYNLWEDSGVPFVDWDSFSSITRAIEAKLKEKNDWYRQHVTDGSPCWCEPEISYTDPETGASVIVHKESQ